MGKLSSPKRTAVKFINKPAPFEYIMNHLKQTL